MHLLTSVSLRGAHHDGLMPLFKIVTVEGSRRCENSFGRIEIGRNLRFGRGERFDWLVN
jgi:hypothetical protein